MTYGGYFVSDQAEKAAKWEAVEEFRERKQHLLVLQNEMLKIGREWEPFANALKSPKSFYFKVEAENITVLYSQQSSQTTAQIPRTHLDWGTLSKLLSDYQATTERIKELEPQFRDLG
jgi:hypothetical protein